MAVEWAIARLSREVTGTVRRASREKGFPGDAWSGSMMLFFSVRAFTSACASGVPILPLFFPVLGTARFHGCRVGDCSSVPRSDWHRTACLT